MQPFYIMAVALLVGWTVALWAGVRYGGYSDEPVKGWWPTRFLAEWFVVGRCPWKAALVAGLCVLLAVVVRYAHGWPSFIAGVVILLVLGLLPAMAVDFALRLRELRSKEFVFFNAVQPISTQHERTVVDGRFVDFRPRVVFYIEDEQLLKIPAVTEDARRYLERFRIAPGLYSAEADGDFMQMFDSLNLYEYVLQPEHSRAIAVFARLLSSDAAGATDPREDLKSAGGGGMEVVRTIAAQGTGAGAIPQTPGKAQAVPAPSHPAGTDKADEGCPEEDADEKRGEEATTASVESLLNPQEHVAQPSKSMPKRGAPDNLENIGSFSDGDNSDRTR